jgi:hypothetical protein
MWRHAKNTSTQEGKKYFYNCNLTKKRGKQFSTGLYILLPPSDIKFDVYVTNCEHDHEAKKVGVATETREYIEKIYQLGTKKPKAIINQIEKENRDILKKNDIETKEVETKEVEVTGLAASVIKKRGRPPLT